MRNFGLWGLARSFAPKPLPYHYTDDGMRKLAVRPEGIEQHPGFAAELPRKSDNTPQVIAHRGSEHNCGSENTLAAFEAAIRNGADAIETDVHLTGDEQPEVVLSHDPSLDKFGHKDKMIHECKLEEIRGPLGGAKMPTFKELLQLLSHHNKEKVWLLLDIKIDPDPIKKGANSKSAQVDDGARRMMEALHGVISTVKVEGVEWRKRIVLGIWSPSYLPYCQKWFSNYPVCNIGFSLKYSRQFLPIKNVSFAMFDAPLFGLGRAGRRFWNDAGRNERGFCVWTVDSKESMRWCIRNNVYGVVTSHVADFIKLREQLKGEKPTGTGEHWPGCWERCCFQPMPRVFVCLFNYEF